MNHKQDAREYLRLATLESAPEWATVHAAHAQAHATLALVEAQEKANEQARIANLINLAGGVESDESLWELFFDKNEGVVGKGVAIQLKPEIREALEIGETR